jgi:hypothetical protein
MQDIKRACELNKSHIISTDEDPGLRIESFAVINLRGVSTNKTIISYVLSRQGKINPCNILHCALLYYFTLFDARRFYSPRGVIGLRFNWTTVSVHASS